MNELLINKYQPKMFEDFCSEHDTDYRTLQFINKMIDINEIKIMILGNVGVGKTTIINMILSKYYNINDIFNKECENILYINNLKEQGIAFYKNEVKTFCKSLCNISSKKKTIVLDDLDLLSEQNQQIFKIYMDMYIDKINFICSCTNLNKINLGISSHLINIKFNSINYNKLKYVINKICSIEKINIDEKTSNDIIIYSNNSIKTLINNLQKIKIIYDYSNNNYSSNNFSMNIINNNIINKYLKEYFDICFIKNLNKAYNILYTIFNDGYSITDILDYMYTYLKNDVNIDEKNKYLLIKLLTKYTININNNYEDILILYFLSFDIISIY